MTDLRILDIFTARFFTKYRMAQLGNLKKFCH